MDGREFFSRVSNHEVLEYLAAKEGPTPDKDVVYVQSKPRGTITEFAISAILEHEWDELLAIMLGHREAKVMRHVARIVGYYSSLQNWNPSKIAELHDRHRGIYSVLDAQSIDRYRRVALARHAPAAVA